MRFLLKVNIPVESGNVAAKAGKLGATIQSILEDLKPEAVYFTDNNGQRAGFIFLEMQDASQIPAIAEPWFVAFNASVEIHPVMVPDDLTKAGGSMRTRSRNTPNQSSASNALRHMGSASNRQYRVARVTEHFLCDTSKYPMLDNRTAVGRHYNQRVR